MTAVTTLRKATSRPARDSRAALVLASAATLIVLMNYTAPAATLSAMAVGLHAGPAGQTWLLSSISLGLSALLLVTGSLADDHGRKRVFIAGAVGLAVTSAVCGGAPNTATFVFGRVLQGAASAALLAAGLGAIGHAFPSGHPRIRATGIWGAMLGAGIALGPLASAALAEPGSWRWWYWAAAGAALLLAGAAGRWLRDSRSEERRQLDVPGVLSLGTGIAALVAAITEGRAGWLRMEVVLLLTAAVALLAGFALVESRRRHPMLDLRLFQRPDFVVATAGSLVTGLSVIGVMSYLPTVLSRALGQTPFAAALILGIWSGTSFVVALQARRVATRLRARHQVAAGLLLCAAGEVAMLGLTEVTPWWRLVPGLVVSGVGSGLLNAALARLAVGSVPADRSGMGSGANNTARYIGASIGTAMVVVVATAHPMRDPAHALARGADLALLLSAAFALAGAALAVLLREPSAVAGSGGESLRGETAQVP
jgi:predicted MFS family arabinose efflux permease